MMYQERVKDLDFKDILKKKAKMLFAVSISIIGDVIPIILIMAGLWIVKYFSRFFGFEDFATIRILTTFSEIFMIILYFALVVESVVIIYKLFKEGEL